MVRRIGIAVVVALAALVMLAGPGSAGAQDGYTVVGVVRAQPDCQGVMPGVTVTLEPLGIAAMTNDAGWFTFENVPDGEYRLVADPAQTETVIWPPMTLTVAGQNASVLWCPQAVPDPAPGQGSLCDAYPHYCVPLVGGADGSGLLEAAGLRDIPAGTLAAPGVVRGVTAAGVPFIGDPDAPLHFALVSSFGCSHCQDYFTGDWQQILQELVLTGQATWQFVPVTIIGGDAAARATPAALCAGEQGAFWEMSDELFRAVREGDNRLRMLTVNVTAANLGLDADALLACVESGRYAETVEAFNGFIAANGINGTPTVLVSYDGLEGDVGSATWGQVAERDPESIRALVAAAPPVEAAPAAQAGFDADGLPLLGPPDAPVQFMVFQNFTCGHCRNYHDSDLHQFIQDYVVTGKANVRVALMAFGSQPYSNNAAYAALCAGEQDAAAFWSMQAELFRLSGLMGVDQAYSLAQIETTAGELGLDPGRLMACVTDARYAGVLAQLSERAFALGVTGTPTTLVSEDGGITWLRISRDYNNMKTLVEAGTAG